MARSTPASVETRFGAVAAFYDRDGVLRVIWGERTPLPDSGAAAPKSLLARLVRAAAGAEVDFNDIPIPAGTPFQRTCWRIARRIPRGRTLTYAEVAKRAGSPGAARAVGQAMRRNPIPLIVPCHRVVGANGLGGYAGTDRITDARCLRKAGLLERERSR